MSRSTLISLAKATISLALIWFLLKRIDLHDVRDRFGALSASTALLALLFVASQAFAAAERWRVVTEFMGAHLPVSAALRITAIGLFFNQTLPSSVGGDAIRIWLATLEGAPLGKSVNTVLSDRLLALLVLIGLMGLTLPLLYQRVPDATARSGVTLIVALGCAASIGFFAVHGWISYWLKKFKLTRALGNLASDFYSLFCHPASLTRLIAWSLLIHLLTIAAIDAIAASLHVNLSFLDCLIVVPAVILVTTAPISVAGWGVREGAMVFGFGQLGVLPVDALAISVLFGIVQILVGLPGGMLWLISRPARPHATDRQ